MSQRGLLQWQQPNCSEGIVAVIQPWHRQPHESPKAYAAFAAYRDLGVERSIDKAYVVLQEARRRPDDKSTPKKEANRHWDVWCSKFNWVERATAYDDYLMQKLADDFESNLLRRQQQVLREGLRDAESLMDLFLVKLKIATMYDVKDLYTLARLRTELDAQMRRALRMPVSTTDVTSGGESLKAAPAIEFIWTDMNDNGGHDSESNSD